MLEQSSERIVQRGEDVRDLKGGCLSSMASRGKGQSGTAKEDAAWELLVEGEVPFPGFVPTRQVNTCAERILQ